ncbi:ferredoxin [Pseudofrankia asymbiotica]|uniref:Ferredoxin n=1 Tax=Pseudofrankia asymbiotica TaxID=1834516 RepID=A0A1V2I8X2_9ACTN|nr:ferredoxin [Pseudofrankia asymbiotica]
MVRVDPLGAELELGPGETIIEAAWRLGYHWPTTCHGQATCLVCQVEVLGGAEHLVPPDDEETDALAARLPGDPRRDATDPRRDPTDSRLACRTRVTGDVVVRKKGVRRVQTVPIQDDGPL